MKELITSKRDFPSVEIIAGLPEFSKYTSQIARPLIIEIIRETVADYKSNFGVKFDKVKSVDLVNSISDLLNRYLRKRIGKVLNGAGILVHTNLGRAPLSEELFDKIKAQTTGYGNLEFDVSTGKRGRRGELAEKYLAMATGAEAGTIVNNNAAALFIILNSFANRRKVVISRSELVQIGGGFRIPDIIKRSGAKLLEVGTTNINDINDYEVAMKEKPALILKVHRSNFDISGFTGEANLKSLVKLGQKYNVPVVNDVGSGVLINTQPFIGKKEPTVQESVRAGVLLTCFSGDKLLGGRQGGFIVGGREYVAKVKKNPIYRVVRIDKTTFSAAEEMLGYYLNDTWQEKIKLWRLASRSQSDLTKLAKEIVKKSGLEKAVSVVESSAEMGGGSLPTVKLKSIAIVFNAKHPDKIASRFRNGDLPLIGRIENGSFLIDLKAIDDSDLEPLITVLKQNKKYITCL